MKKALILTSFIVISVLGFISCENQTISVINESSKRITYALDYSYSGGYKYDHFTIEPGEQKTHNVTNGSLKNYVSSELGESVYLETQGDVYTFKDVSPIPVHIFNSLSMNIILTASGYLSTNPLTVTANSEVTTETVCTKTPSFTAKTLDGYPVDVTSMFDNTKFMVTIH